jgi:hypothetical protein
LVPIGPVVSEKKFEMRKVYRRQTTDDGRQVMAIMFTWTFGPGELITTIFC